MTFVIEPLARKHNRSNFLCGKDSLDTYIREQVSQEIRRGASTAYVLVDTPNMDVLGYYTLSCSAINLVDIDQDLIKRLPRYPSLPAMLIGRLAIHKDHSRKGHGKLLLMDSFKRILKISNELGACAVVVDVLDEDALGFYLKFGFQTCQSNSMKLYYLIHSIKALGLGQHLI
jgi:GNAT superfamily N-acetyltransferase